MEKRLKLKNEEGKKYKAIDSQMFKKIRKLFLIATVTTSLGIATSQGIKYYNDQQTTRQAKSFDKQINDYNYDLYDKIEELEKNGFDDLTNNELIELINEVNNNNYEAIKSKIAQVIPNCSGEIFIHREDRSIGSLYSVDYKDSTKGPFDEQGCSLDDSKLKSKVDRFIEIRDLVQETEKGDIKRNKLEKVLKKLKIEMKEDADIGVYINSKDGSLENGKLKTYNISNKRDKIEEKLDKLGQKSNDDYERK